MQIIECVVNISQGQNAKIIDYIASAGKSSDGVQLLSVHSNEDANRTVLTFLGTPQAVFDAAFSVIEAASQSIDMRFQHGAHPRLGATDVCPFVPVQNISLQETAAWAKKLGEKVAAELHIPVYFYEANASAPERQNLAFIRRGEYESLAEKIGALPPDLGPRVMTELVQKTGATVIGARNFLIALNVNLNTKDVRLAKQIAKELRASSGGLPTVKAIGWYMPSYNRAQVSCNLTDFHIIPPHILLETAREIALWHDVEVTGSELIGLIPKEALLMAGRFYSNAQTQEDLLEAAVQGLNLAELAPFDVHQRVLELKAGLI